MNVPEIVETAIHISRNFKFCFARNANLAAHQPIKPRQKSGAQRIVFCPQCSVSLALGLSPEGALNVAAWDMIRDLVSSDPALNQAAWENLRGTVRLLEAGEGVAEPEPRSDAWVNFSRVG